MSKIVVKRQEYANNGTHADEIKSVVDDILATKEYTITSSVGTFELNKIFVSGKVVQIQFILGLTSSITAWSTNIATIPSSIFGTKQVAQQFQCALTSGSDYSGSCVLQLTDGGNIRSSTSLNSGMKIRANIVYILS